jgi:hypothetical protein
MLSVFSDRARPELWKGMVAGAVGGLGATIAMTAFQGLWSYMDQRLRRDGPNGDSLEDLTSEQLAWEEDGHGEVATESATERAAERLARGFFGHELSERNRELAGSALHFGFGTAVGAVYGAVAEYSEGIARGEGIPFGTGLMVAADDVAVPALGLSESPQDLPWSSHLYLLASHALYGGILEALRRAIRRAL